MKAYKVTLLVIDHDELGGEEIEVTFENIKYPNYCMHPRVMDVEEADIGEWDDNHPLNNYNTMEEEFDKLFEKGEET